MNSQIDIDEGYSFSMLIQGVVVMVLGGLLFKLHVIPAVTAIVLGLSLFLVKSGLRIDKEARSVQDYKSWFGLRWGPWFSIQDFNAYVLRYTHESREMNGRFGTQNIRTHMFELCMDSKAGEEESVHVFTDYALASKATAVLSGYFQLEGRDEYADKQAALRKRRASSGRK